MQGPRLDLCLACFVRVERAAVAAPTRGSADLCGSDQRGCSLPRMRIARLADDFCTIRGLHGVVPVAMEDDEGHRSNGLPAGY